MRRVKIGGMSPAGTVGWQKSIKTTVRAEMKAGRVSFFRFL
jgi:hypothetical protein